MHDCTDMHMASVVAEGAGYLCQVFQQKITESIYMTDRMSLHVAFLGKLTFR